MPLKKRSVTALIIVAMTGISLLIAALLAAIIWWRARLLRDVQDDE